jgi:hypothetical protein
MDLRKVLSRLGSSWMRPVIRRLCALFLPSSEQ